MVEKTFKYDAKPENTTTSKTAWQHIQYCREVYNHALTQHYRPKSFNNKPSYTTLQNKLPSWKQHWTEWKQVYSKCLQMALKRIQQSQRVLTSLQERGFNVGRLKWKAPSDYRSITYNQSGFDVDNNTGRNNHATVTLSKLGTFHLTYHRPLPNNATIKQVILKKEKTGDWSICITIEDETTHPEKPAIDNIDKTETVGIDLGITKFIHDSTGRKFSPLDESQDQSRIEKRHRSLSRKEYQSKNWVKARQKLARAYKRLSNKRKAYRERIANEYTQEYNAIFVEDLNVSGMMQQKRNSRNISSMSWRKMIDTFKYFGKKNGCYVVEVDPRNTTKDCVKCGVSSEKPLWVREHSCPSCGFETDRDLNAALEVKRRGLIDLGVVGEEEFEGLGQELAESTLVETGASADNTFSEVVPASSVVETRSPVLKEAVSTAE